MPSELQIFGTAGHFLFVFGEGVMILIKFVQDSLTRKALRGALNPCARKLSDFTIGFS
jgi:hypothetical protein